MAMTGEGRSGAASRVAPISREAPRALVLLTFFLANLAVLLRFCDLDGYEGDDLNSIVPMFHLAEAKQGLLLIYRYAWQPLSYELGGALFRLTGDPDLLFRLAPLAAATALTLLFWQGWSVRTDRRGAIAALALLLTVPEYWHSGLYYNSSILALPFLAAAILLVRAVTGWKALLCAGLLTGTATLMRADFILASPLLAVFAWHGTKRLSAALVFAAGVLTALATAMLIGLLEPVQLFQVYMASSAEIAQKANSPGWDFRTKFFVFTLILSPIGWLVFLCGGALFVIKADGPCRVRAATCVLATSPMLFPLKDILSVKYALPLLAFAPVTLMHCLAAIEAALPTQRNVRLPALLLAGSVALLFLSVSHSSRAPFLVPGTVPARSIGTHDGERSYGGYAWTMARVGKAGGKAKDEKAAATLANDFLAHDGPDIVIVGEEGYFHRGGLGWRHLQLSLERAGVHGEVAGPTRIVFVRGSRRLWLVGPDAVMPATTGAITFDLRDPS